ncbi:OsmC family protein [Metallosphaera hakonensis]|nr:OsmC family protein [Metallosphaera hakonensis]
MITFTAEGRLDGDSARVTIKDTELKIGLMGSDDPTPEEVLLGAALSCMILTIYYISREMGVQVKNVEGYIEGTLDPKGFQGDPNIPPGLLQVKYDLTIDSDDERMDEVMKLSMRRCPLKDTLMRRVDVDVSWKIRKT